MKHTFLFTFTRVSSPSMPWKNYLEWQNSLNKTKRNKQVFFFQNLVFSMHDYVSDLLLLCRQRPPLMSLLALRGESASGI